MGVMGVGNDTYVELRTKYRTGWTPPPTEYPNEYFVKPVPAAEWARFTLVYGNERQLGIGSSNHPRRMRGQLIIQLFTPQESGAVDVLVKADTCATVFRSWTNAATVVVEEASVIPVGSDEFGYYQVNVEIDFWVETLY
jgi:hypothetical protein